MLFTFIFSSPDPNLSKTGFFFVQNRLVFGLQNMFDKFDLQILLSLIIIGFALGSVLDSFHYSSIGNNKLFHKSFYWLFTLKLEHNHYFIMETISGRLCHFKMIYFDLI